MKDCWKFILTLLVLEGIVFLITGSGALQISLPRLWVYLIMVILCLCWLLELGKRYAFLSLLISKSVKVTIAPDKVIVGRFPFRKTFSRELNLNFLMEEIKGQSGDTVYENAHKIFLTCDNARTHLIAEIADPVLAARFHMNLKTILEFHLNNEFDLDPTKRAEAILPSG